jgi:hypothetical protein
MNGLSFSIPIDMLQNKKIMKAAGTPARWQTGFGNQGGRRPSS